jgi:hypothetical protein
MFRTLTSIYRTSLVNNKRLTYLNDAPSEPRKARQETGRGSRKIRVQQHERRRDVGRRAEPNAQMSEPLLACSPMSSAIASPWQVFAIPRRLWPVVTSASSTLTPRSISDRPSLVTGRNGQDVSIGYRLAQAGFGFGRIDFGRAPQDVALDTMQLCLEPALLQPVHPRQCLVERLQRLGEILGAEVKPSQQAEKAGGVLLDANGLGRRQALAELGNARLDRPAFRPPSRAGRRRERPRPTGRGLLPVSSES